MSIAIRRPQSNHHAWQWLAAGSATVAVGVAGFAGIRAMTSSGPSEERPAVTTYVDMTGLGVAFSTQLPSEATYVDMTGLGVAFSTQLPSDATYVDMTGLGVAFSTQLPSDPSP